MKPVLNQLIQFQELCFALSERSATTRKRAKSPEVEALEKSVANLRRRIPSDARGLVDQLRDKSPLFIAPAVDGACTACRNALPTAIRSSVEVAGSLEQCPHCSRLLYAPEMPGRLTGKRAGAGRRAKEGLSQFSSSSLIIPNLEAKTRDKAIAELVALMASQGFVEDEKSVKKAALAREAIDSTAVERGMAFPHVRGIEGGGLTMALGMKRGGLDFGAPDGHKTRIIFFTVIPTAASAFYLRLLSGLIQVFREADHRRRLLDGRDPEEVWETLAELTQQTIP
jgi:mannitol/fructose-specific phosphotransferase system IIA component (Ntr-type)